MAQQSQTSGTGTATLLFLLFLGLKLAGAIGWSWWWVTCPLWAGAAFAVAVLLLIAVVLSAVTRGFAWQPGENEATCLIDPFSRMVQTISGAFQVPTAVIHYGNGDSEKAHRAGQKGCSCGFYAYFDLGHNPHHQKGNVLGLIEGYGLMTVGDRGFRCEKARLAALVDESQRSAWWRRIVCRRVAADVAGVAWWVLMLAAFRQPGWARDLFGGMLGLQLGLSAFGWKRWLTRPVKSTVPARVRELYPDVKIYPSVSAALAEHPLVKPELPSPESDPEFWQRAL